MRKITTLALIATGLAALGCGAGSTDADTSSNGDASGATRDAGDAKGNDKPKTAKIGQPARDGKFEFTVKSSKCGATKIGSDLVSSKAQGQFCLVTINVKNIGKEPQTLDGSSQKAYAADGTEYSTDTEAGLYANQGQSTFFEEINPGNQVTGVFVFDVPKNVKLTKLELHDSAFSGGVTVSLA
ncbi:DUF4352 domain-containing protein [Micromonospora echinofusca]|uniref:DUF4352 domain-containing protein n=1 Tax=Micromonospora echinofusca TaxID=47858 RepID=A0ABS3VVT6_MICEH|nr:DUF4352 domain-containing protein [Micromonospora echinofusca]MBO4208640.1 DUF4352 domain-containing protein [Micromonospora echinofusca]